MPAVDYSDGRAPLAKPALTRAQRRRRRIVWALVITPIALLIYLFFLGNTRARVWLHHGVKLPPLACEIQCSGFTPMLFRSGMPAFDSDVEFAIPATELAGFLSQFPVSYYVPNNRPVYSTTRYTNTRPPATMPYTGTPTPDGIIGSRSPTGRDWCSVEWRTDGTWTHVWLHTSWN